MLNEDQIDALKLFGEARKTGMLRDCKDTGQGYVLIYTWLEAVWDIADHTGQLRESYGLKIM